MKDFTRKTLELTVSHYRQIALQEQESVKQHRKTCKEIIRDPTLTTQQKALLRKLYTEEHATHCQDAEAFAKTLAERREEKINPSKKRKLNTGEATTPAQTEPESELAKLRAKLAEMEKRLPQTPNYHGPPQRGRRGGGRGRGRGRGARGAGY